MSKIKSILLMGLSMVLVAALSIAGTVAYLKDEDSAVNVMTLGNVSIAQHEYERVVDENGNWVKSEYTGYGYTADKMQKFTQAKPALPAVYQDGDIKFDDRNGSQAASGEGSHQQPWSQVGAPGSNQLFDDSVKNVIDKFVFVENTGKTNAYYRTLIAIECPEGFDANLIGYNTNSNTRFDWSFIGEDSKGGDSFITVDGVRYFVRVATYNQVLTPGEVSRPSLLQLFLDPSVTNEDCAKFGATWDVLVVSQAVQAAGFANAETALDAAFGDITTTNHPWSGKAPALPTVVSTAAELKAALANGGEIILANDIDMSDWTSIDIGYKAFAIDGNGYSILSLSAPLYSEMGPTTSSVKNLTFTNANISVSGDTGSAGVVVGYMNNNGGGKLTIDNCHVVDSEINAYKWAGAFIGANASDAGAVEITNCTVKNTTISTTDSSCGAIIGHTYAITAIKDCKILGTTSISCDEDRDGSAAKAGYVVGTVNAGVTTITNVSVDDTVTLTNVNSADPLNDGYVGRNYGTVTVQ